MERRFLSVCQQGDIPLLDQPASGIQRSIAPSPALSLERIRVDYSKGSRVKRIFLSPSDRSGFLNDLAFLDRGLQHDQNGLVRSAGRIMPLQAREPGVR